MSGYINDPDGTKKVLRNDWYIGFKDICFSLKNETDGELDFFWVGRDSAMLIRGGANYAYDQMNSELKHFVIEVFHDRAFPSFVTELAFGKLPYFYTRSAILKFLFLPHPLSGSYF